MECALVKTLTFTPAILNSNGVSKLKLIIDDPQYASKMKAKRSEINRIAEESRSKTTADELAECTFHPCLISNPHWTKSSVKM